MSDRVAIAVQALNEAYLRRFPGEAVGAVSQMPVADVVELLESQSVPSAITIWNQLPGNVASLALGQLGEPLVRQLLSRSDPVRVARLLAQLGAGEREGLLTLLNAGKRRELQELVSYPEESAGSFMDTRFVPLNERLTVREALQRIRKVKPRFTRDLFVVDAQGQLHRLVRIQDLALADGTVRLETLTKPIAQAVLPTTSRAELVSLFEQSRLTDIPVVDVDGKLIGVVRYDALVEAVREETSADIQSMVGASRDERALSKVSFVVRKRLPWLQINLLTAFLAAAVVGVFESTIAQFTALAVLLPVVAGQSGNTGAQALAVTMRGLALREIGTSHWRRVAVKELGAGFVNGVAVAVTTALGVWVWSSSYGLALVIGLSMVISMVAAALSGVIVPVILSTLGQDPAQSSSIILTTVTDVTGFFTFLGIATLLASLI